MSSTFRCPKLNDLITYWLGALKILESPMLFVPCNYTSIVSKILIYRCCVHTINVTYCCVQNLNHYYYLRGTHTVFKTRIRCKIELTVKLFQVAIVANIIVSLALLFHCMNSSTVTDSFHLFSYSLKPVYRFCSSG